MNKLNLDSPIIIDFQGGLGNQFFQYCEALRLQKMGVRVFLSKYGYLPTSKRDFQLDKLLKLELNFIEFKSYIRYYGLTQSKRYFMKIIVDYSKSYLVILKHYLLSIMNVSYNGMRQKILETNLNATTNFSDVYFQDYKKVLSNINSILDSRISPNYTLDQFKLIERIQSDNSVVLHIRGGDFISENFTSFDEDLLYYRRSIDFFKNSIPDCLFLVFTDDLEYSLLILDAINSLNYRIISSPKFSNIDEINLMSNGVNFIISKSTFAWVSAVLNIHNYKTVICPSNYMAHQNLILPNWVSL